MERSSLLHLPRIRTCKCSRTHSIPDAPRHHLVAIAALPASTLHIPTLPHFYHISSHFRPPIVQHASLLSLQSQQRAVAHFVHVWRHCRNVCRIRRLSRVLVRHVRETQGCEVDRRLDVAKQRAVAAVAQNAAAAADTRLLSARGTTRTTEVQCRRVQRQRELAVFFQDAGCHSGAFGEKGGGWRDDALGGTRRVQLHQTVFHDLCGVNRLVCEMNRADRLAIGKRGSS